MSCYNTPPDIECGTYEEAATKSKPTFRRVPVHDHDRRLSASQLSVHASVNTPVSPQLNRRDREAIHRRRDFVFVPIDPQEPKPFPVKFALKLTSLKLTQLVRRQKKFARMASTAKHILDKMTPGRLRSAVEGQQESALNCFRQVNAEIKARALACEGRLA